MRYIFFLLLLLTIQTGAQTINGSIKWKSAKGIEYNYIGELLNGKPNGVGFATTKDGMERVFGYFKNGMQSGKAAIWSLGYKTIADYNEKDGYAYGPGAVAAPGDFKVGEFNHDKFEGKLIVLTSYEIYFLKDGENYMNGRILKIWGNGNYLTDGYNVDGKLNGIGSYLDVKEGKAYSGTWKDNVLTDNYTGNYSSFLQNKNLGVQDNEDHILIYSAASADGKLSDTCLVYDKNKNHLTFGYFENGTIRKGIFAGIDKFGVVGNWNENGDKEGYCVSYDQKADVFVTGNYKNGKLHGQVVSFNDEDDIIYIGEASEGEFTGKGALLKNKKIYSGTFKNGKLNGDGKVVFEDGRSVSGKYEDGKLSFTSIKEVIKPDGKKVDINPKDFNAAINFLLKEWENNFMNINSGELSESERGYYSWYNFPNGFCYIEPDRVGLGGKPHNELSTLIDLDVFKSKTELYYDLCKKLSACTITSLVKGKSFKLIPKINKLPEDGQFERIASFFTIPEYPGKKSDPQIRVMVESVYDGYQLTVDIISKWK